MDTGTKKFREIPWHSLKCNCGFQIIMECKTSTENMQAGKKVKLVECLPGKHGDLNLISRTHIKKHKTKQNKNLLGESAATQC